MPDGTTYEQDFHLWTQDQARRLRAAAMTRSNFDVDWENVAEEIESLGRSDKRELRSRLDTIYEHLLKLYYSPAAEPRNGWIDTIEHARAEVDRLLIDSPSLRQTVDRWKIESAAKVGERAANQLRRYGEAAAAAHLLNTENSALVERVLDEDFFPHPPGPSTSTSA